MEYMEKLPPIKITFEKFARTGIKYVHHNLYIIWMKKQALYVGISRNNIWHRWFGQRDSHIYMIDDQWIKDYSSPIGSVIVYNRPASLKWKIELQHYRTYLFDENLAEVEKGLIHKLRPLFNTTYLPYLTKKEQELARSLTDWQSVLDIPLDAFPV
jgi:hypothetical protein